MYFVAVFRGGTRSRVVKPSHEDEWTGGMSRTTRGTSGGGSGSRGLSPVVGTVLLVAIVLVLAAVLANLSLGFSDRLRSPAPQGAYSTEYHPGGEDNGGYPYFELRYEGGPSSDASNIYVRDESGNEVAWADVWTAGDVVESGEYIHIDGYLSDGALDHVCEAGQEYLVIVRDDDGRTLMMMGFEAPSVPDPPSGWC